MPGQISGPGHSVHKKNHTADAFAIYVQKTTKNISFHKVVPGTLVCVPCPRSTFAHVTLILTFLNAIVHHALHNK